MASDKKRRLTTAVGFLFGLIAAMDALRDAAVVWPPDAAWAQMSHPHRLEFGGGVALIVVTIIISVVGRHRT
ncbi:MAG TPA: hypothetical protein VKV39_02235 [Candidatus Sulfotelmatobacter sp.]|nr:hypothetical protein [Candidatus Sulfotelmatobacter sp.]